MKQMHSAVAMLPDERALVAQAAVEPAAFAGACAASAPFVYAHGGSLLDEAVETALRMANDQ